MKENCPSFFVKCDHPPNFFCFWLGPGETDLQAQLMRYLISIDKFYLSPKSESENITHSPTHQLTQHVWCWDMLLHLKRLKTIENATGLKNLGNTLHCSPSVFSGSYLNKNEPIMFDANSS